EFAPGYVGAWGQPVPVTAPDRIREPSGADYARQMLAQSYPPHMLMQAGYNPPLGGGGGAGAPPGMPPGGGCCGPAGCYPPGATGMVPGGGLPGGLPPGMPGGGGGIGMPPMPAGAVAAVGALTGPGMMPHCSQRTEIRFVGPAGMKIAWYSPGVNGKV